MDKEKTIALIEILSQKWKIKNKKFFFEIINFLDKNVNKKFSFFNGFEFSFIENQPKVRLLHLDFWYPTLSLSIFKKIIEKREKTIILLFKKFSQKFHCFYSLELLKKFFQFNREEKNFPIQFGFEWNKKSQPRLKVYLSINGINFSLKKFCHEFQLNKLQTQKNFLKNKKFDTIALDFFPHGGYCFKFYPLLTKSKGLLLRINKDSKIISIKKWKRFPKGLEIEDSKVRNFIKLPKYLFTIIKKLDFKVHYLCEENSKKSIYFR